MKKLIIILVSIVVVILLVLGFSMLFPKAMTNDEIISETKKCQDAGMYAGRYFNMFTGSTYSIICSPNN